MTKHIRKSPALPLLTAALLLAGVGAAHGGGQERPTIPFPVADLFFELNNSAGDLGIHAEIDGGPWTSLEVEGPGERKLLSIVSKSRLRTQGLTQLAFESAEPPFSELDPADFFRRFPEGEYDIDHQVWDLALADHVRRALESLQPGERAAVELAYFGGMTYREVAAALGEAEGTVKSRIRSGLRRLRAELSAAGVSVGDS